MSPRGGPTTARPRRHRLRQAITILVVSALLLWAVIAVIPGLSVDGSLDLLLATLVIGIVSAALRPLLALLATMLGWIGVVLVGLVAQALIFYAALSLTPGVTLSGFWPAFWASWLFTFLISLVGWFFDANDDEVFARDVLRYARDVEPTADGDRPGVVFVQIDGLPAPLLQWAVQAGDLPTLSGWIRSGTHRLTAWHPMLPATTPASQAGILHGRSAAVPAFRWYEKERQRLTVTSRPKDAASIEKGMSDGRGLLAYGGASIGNIFSGDAPCALLTMSVGRGHGPSRRFTASYMRPLGLTRSLLLTLGEMAKEVYQGYRQQSRGIEPRIDRFSSYVALRGVTNVLLRDLNVRLLAEQMLAGTPVMYCDFTDYDEIAHHAGPTRPESVASLAGVDRALGTLTRIAELAPRRYEFVVLSDHGQSQGATFRQRYGEPFEDVVRRLVSQAGTNTAEARPATVTQTADDEEEWGRVGNLLREVGAGRGVVAGASRRVVERREKTEEPPDAGGVPDLVVTGSGNLAFVYFPRLAGRATWETIEDRFPGLLDALTAHDGVGFAVVWSPTHGTVALGDRGRHFVDLGRVDGDDPLAPFGPHAAAEVRRHSQLAHVGDIVVNSRIDPVTEEVAAFEELVGCHGGLGGWQSDAVLVHPSGWSPPAPLVGADAVHRQLIRWLAELGQRAELATAPTGADE